MKKELRASCVFIETLLYSNYLFFRNFYPKTASHFSEVALWADFSNSQKSAQK